MYKVNNATIMVNIITKDESLRDCLKRWFEDLSEYKVARKLGISRSTWHLAIAGDGPIGITVLRAILRTYPELTDNVVAYLRDGDRENE